VPIKTYGSEYFVKYLKKPGSGNGSDYGSLRFFKSSFDKFSVVKCSKPWTYTMEFTPAVIPSPTNAIPSDQVIQPHRLYYQNEREDWHPPFFIVFGLLISLHKKGNLRKQSIAFYAGKISRADSHDIQTVLF
jgi:hypothetical protein